MKTSLSIIALVVIILLGQSKEFVIDKSENRQPYLYSWQGPAFPIKGQVLAVITAYNPTESQTDSDPMVMASGKVVYEGAAACPAYLKIGQSVEMGDKTYTCEDRMAKRYRQGNYFDILMFDEQEAKEWGRQELLVLIY